MAAGRSPDKSLRQLAFEETKEAPPEAEAPPFPEVERPATAASAPSRPETPHESADEAVDDDEGATVATADEEAPAEPAEEPTVEPPAEPAADEPSGDASAAEAAADEEAPPAGDGFAAPDVEE